MYYTKSEIQHKKYKKFHFQETILLYLSKGTPLGYVDL